MERWRGNTLLKAVFATAPSFDFPTELDEHSHSHILFLLRLRFLFQSLKIGKEVVNIGLREFVEQVAMRGQGILQFHFHLIA
jgi:hypothetical protein